MVIRGRSAGGPAGAEHLRQRRDQGRRLLPRSQGRPPRLLKVARVRHMIMLIISHPHEMPPGRGIECQANPTFAKRGPQRRRSPYWFKDSVLHPKPPKVPRSQSAVPMSPLRRLQAVAAHAPTRRAITSSQAPLSRWPKNRDVASALAAVFAIARGSPRGPRSRNCSIHPAATARRGSALADIRGYHAQAVHAISAGATSSRARGLPRKRGHMPSDIGNGDHDTRSQRSGSTIWASSRAARFTR